VTRPDLGDIAAPVWMPARLRLAPVTVATVDGYSGAVCATPLAEAGLVGVVPGLRQRAVMMGVGLRGGAALPRQTDPAWSWTGRQCGRWEPWSVGCWRLPGAPSTRGG
jgi:hypothetical protein